MREILFRGKRKDCNVWEFGNFSSYSRYDGTNLCYINGFEYEVYPETIGQYTGMTDKNGTKIFEGDIFKPFDDEIIVVSWIEHFSTLGLMVYTTIRKKVRRKEEVTVSSGWSMLMDYDLNEREIIGNIHDNPELLKGGAE